MKTLPEYIAWFREHQDAARAIPTRLHDDDTDGELGGLVYSSAFRAYLMAKPNDEIDVPEPIACSHIHDSTWPRCSADRRYYRAPMWRAMVQLSFARPQVRPSHPKPYALVVFLMDSGYDWRLMSERLALPYELGEALLVMALRKLYGLYQKGPIPDRNHGWVSLSESQRNAVLDGEGQRSLPSTDAVA